MSEEFQYDDEEDVFWLSSCALTGDYSTLWDGVVQPEFLGEDCQYVAMRLLEARDTTTFVPSLEDLRVTYPIIDWPDDRDVPTDPNQAADRLLIAYQMILSTQVSMQFVLAAREYAPGTEEMQKALDETMDALLEVRNLGNEAKTSERFGDDIDAIISVLHGAGTRTSQFKCNIDMIDEYMRTWEPGLHGLLARPKHGKSRFAYRAAAYNGFSRDSRGVVVDIENTRKIAIARIVCSVFDRYEEALLDVIRKGEEARQFRVQGQPVPERFRYTDADREELSWFEGAMEDLKFGSRIQIFGKEDIARMGDAFTLEFVLQHADEIRADWLIYEQLHTARSRASRSNEKDSTRIMRCAEVLSNWPKVSLATTQKNRDAAAKHKFEWDSSHDRHAFGSDGISQKCSSFWGLQTFRLEPENAIGYYDGRGVHRECNHIQCYTPIERRERSGASESDRIFVAFDASSYIQTMGNDAGTQLVNDDIALKYKRLGIKQKSDSKSRASKTKESGGTRSRSSRRRQKIKPIVMDDENTI